MNYQYPCSSFPAMQALRLCGLAVVVLGIAMGLQSGSLCAAESGEGEPVQGADYVERIRTEIRNVDSEQLAQMIENVDGLVLIDVRETAEIPYSGGTINAPRLFNISRGWVEFHVPERVPDRSTPIVVYCDVSTRSVLATRRLMDMGYTNVSNYADGFLVWRDSGYPVTSDTAPYSMLYQAPVQVSENVWSAIGATAPPTYENSGHNNNLSFIITSEGVVVVNAGDNYLLADSLHREIRKITDQPVKYVILENGQGHAMLGSNYWQEQGVSVIAHIDTLHEIEEYGADVFYRMLEGRRDKGMGTELTVPDITFEDRYVIELGGETIEALHLGPAHSPGDISVWLPRQKLVIAGDIAFHERLLPVMERTDTAGWIETWQAFLDLGAEKVIPGHGGPTDYAQVEKYTKDYLVYMREQVGTLVDEGGELQDAYLIDQSAYNHLDTFFELSRRNAGRIFREMEFDF
jgi:glyoxylase-like metal-dependent hydrolase (beta-lactamase superfamily II)/rhodanese-related sulfurtransferase